MTWTTMMDWRVRGAAVFVLAASVLVVRATVVAFGETAAAAAPPLPALRLQPAVAPAAAVDIGRLADIAPFGASRVELAMTRADLAASFMPVSLVGTIAGADQPAAICRLGGAPARILHVGDTIGGLRLQLVAPARAVFIDGAAQRHELRLNSPGN